MMDVESCTWADCSDPCTGDAVGTCTNLDAAKVVRLCALGSIETDEGAMTADSMSDAFHVWVWKRFGWVRSINLKLLWTRGETMLSRLEAFHLNSMVELRAY